MSTSRRSAKSPAGRLARRRPGIVAVAVLTGLLGSGAFVWQSTQAAFTATTGNPASTWSTGSVALSDDDGGTALFTGGTKMVPTTTYTYNCITVTFTGDVASTVKLYASANTDASPQLAQYINLTIEEGTGGTFGNCTGFAAGGTIYSGTLGTFNGKTAFANGVGTWTPSANGTKVYRIGYALDTGTPNTAQGKTTTTTFQWEAQSN